VFPHIDGEQRLRAFRERCVGVVGFDDLELVAVLHQPGPTLPNSSTAAAESFFLHSLTSPNDDSSSFFKAAAAPLRLWV